MSGRTDPRTAFSIHDFPDNIDPDMVEAGPVVDALTGSDMANKVSSRSWAINGASNGYEILHYFARDKLSEQEIADAEKLFSSVSWSMMLTNLINFFHCIP